MSIPSPHPPQSSNREEQPAIPAIPSALTNQRRSTQRKRISAQEWDLMRTTIRTLYITEGLTLRNTMELLEEKYSFRASEKSFKFQLKKWNLNKNTKKANSERCTNPREIERPVDVESTANENSRPRETDEASYELCSVLNAPSSESVQSLPKWIGLTWQGHDKSALDSMLNKGRDLENRGEYGDAEEKYRQCYKGYDHLLGPTNQKTLQAIRYIDQMCRKLEKAEEAEALLVKTITLCKDKFGQMHGKSLEFMEIYAVNLQAQKRFADSEVVLSQVLEGYETLYKSTPIEQFEKCKGPVLLLATAHLKQDAAALAVELLEDTLTRASVTVLAQENEKLMQMRNELVRLYVHRDGTAGIGSLEDLRLFESWHGDHEIISRVESALGSTSNGKFLESNFQSQIGLGL
ncbi:MAG: hypothetical protein Q9187_005644 [Circinaria calcarea]